MNDKISRREALQQSAALGALALAGVAACGKDQPKALVCTDTTGLAPTDLQVRTTLQYADSSPEAGKNCTNCQQFVPAADASQCGTCKVLKGPINPKGYCKSYVAKPA